MRKQQPHDLNKVGIQVQWYGRTLDNGRTSSCCSLWDLEPLRLWYLLPPDPLLRSWGWNIICLEPALRPVHHEWPCQETLGDTPLRIIGTHKSLHNSTKVSVYGEERVMQLTHWSDVTSITSRYLWLPAWMAKYPFTVGSTGGSVQPKLEAGLEPRSSGTLAGLVNHLSPSHSTNSSNTVQIMSGALPWTPVT